ncbi:ricin-type beta-trefoil lectin domain protein [Rhodococcus sp. NPDC003318]|uniref:ricin-type beta-trefoil lectin domain protein n=1 Tax=Rhodococcus sp. NPDC003318 TaxID=3364503 RepID=UPI00368390EF
MVHDRVHNSRRGYRSRLSVLARPFSGTRAKSCALAASVLVAAAAGGIVALPSAAVAATPGTVRTSGGLCLDNKWGVTTNGNAVQVYQCNQSPAQSWTIEADATVRVQGRCLTPQNNRSGAALVVDGCTGAANQRWTPRADGSVVSQANGMCAENRDGREVNENPVVVRACSGAAAQRWVYSGVPATTPTTTAVPPTTTTATVPPVPTTTVAAPVSPSGIAAPRGNLPGWRQIFVDDFTKAAAVGTWANACDPDKIVYTGAEGRKWRTYPSCYLDTYQKRPYRPDQVLSVANGVLNFHLHPVDGLPAGANPSPLIDGNSQYQTFGRYSARFKVDSPDLSEYYVAWLLWPQSERWPQDGEFDFPEGGLAGTAGGFHHYSGAGSCVGGCQELATDIGARFTDWHTYTIEWSPGRIRYLLDDRVVLDSTAWVPSTPMRWQLQTETNGNGSHSGNLLVDWVSVWARDTTV